MSEIKVEIKSEYITAKIKPSIKRAVMARAKKKKLNVSEYITELIIRDLQGKEEIEFK